jgi:hypothetical protein
VSAAYQPRIMTPKLRDEILFDAECFYCGAYPAGDVEHVIPFSHGGSDHRDNLVAACSRCNIEKTSMRPDEWEAWRRERGYCWPPRSINTPAGRRVVLELCDLLLMFVDVEAIDVASVISKPLWKAFRNGATAEELAAMALGLLLLSGSAQ